MSLKFIDEIIIHPGYPKTGTTFFQKNIFSKLDNINYIGKTGNDDANFVNNINLLRQYICNNKKVDLDVEKILINFFKERSNKKKIHLLSSEFFFDVEQNKINDNFKYFVSINEVCEKIIFFF